MTVQGVALLIAAALTLYALFESQGRSALAWAVLIVILVELAVRLT